MKVKSKHIQQQIFRLFVVFFLCFSANLFAQDGDITSTEEYKKGESLFSANCTSCHKVHDKLTGPQLKGITEKYETEWLYKWIKNNSALVKTGDPLAVVASQYATEVMTPFPMLTDKDIDAILTYVENAPVPVKVEPTSVDGVAAANEGWTPSNIFLAIITLILLVIAIILSRVVRMVTNIVREKDGLEPIKPTTPKSLLSNRAFKVAAGLLIFILFSYFTYDSAQSVGRQQGYQPEQPIKFSHALHAGKWEIDCQYCHSGAREGKSAVIPSTNVCMNCHKAIDKGPEYGTEEISKIYAAIGWDKEKKEYIEGYEQKPIEWVRIHNLPDHVYFSHAQHVTAGGVECQTCHGEVENMEVVEQHSSLGMGWCITCHQETEVQFATNGYYSIYEKYHKDMKDGKMDKVTVEDIGGLECQKCHY